MRNDVGMQIRSAEPQDLDVLCRLRIEFLTEYRGLTPDAVSDHFVDQTRRFFQRKQADGTVLSWIAEDGGRTVGIVSVVLQDAPPHPEDPRSVEGLLINMFVRQPERGRGIGRLLLRACLASGPDYGIRRFNLYATEAGRSLYVNEGFSNRDDWMVLQLPHNS
jgi:GNAT superfamily N-acetyltransferase